MQESPAFADLLALLALLAHFFRLQLQSDSLTLRGRRENFHFPLRPVPARPKAQLTALIAHMALLFLPAASNPNKGRENTKFDHLAKTKDLAARHPRARTP